MGGNNNQLNGMGMPMGMNMGMPNNCNDNNQINSMGMPMGMGMPNNMNNNVQMNGMGMPLNDSSNLNGYNMGINVQNDQTSTFADVNQNQINNLNNMGGGVLSYNEDNSINNNTL